MTDKKPNVFETGSGRKLGHFSISEPPEHVGDVSVNNIDILVQLKQNKARTKSAFTRCRHQLLYLLDEEDLPSRRSVRSAQKKSS